MKQARKWLSAAFVVFGLFTLSACDIFFLGEAEAVSLMGTDKTLGDHIISLSSGKDCSTVRRERGLSYCVEDEKTINQNIYCYRDLGGVTCYDKPDPHKNGSLRVDRNEHNLAK